MKVLMVNGQNHKGSTYHIGRILAEKITDTEQITEIFLPRDMPHFCCGCTQCFMVHESKCPHYKEIQPITELIDDADVLIFTSPVYVFHATGSMKALLDHYGYRWMVHRPEEKMFHKQAVAISTAAGGGMKSTCKDIKDSFFFWGVGKIYSFGIAVFAVKWVEVPTKRKTKIEKKTDQLARRIKRNDGHVSPGIKTKLLFRMMQLAQKKGLIEPDARYWREKRWTEGIKPW